ncbi:DUF58 domain-containing protein [Allorhodopirellula solitaria]|uniref:DUF58 domain-containing protein n=1 Tax=Allorhodopirellula solitaria TaxID=2527987 RepID=A0A5C5YJK4_9BACT|nr:DUF58 domain-containing protein [Allorhodopirellula solitaria]TWT75065.1 hypothetical protein CA85_03530 [Allorhodopirellula solitaria]
MLSILAQFESATNLDGQLSWLSQLPWLLLILLSLPLVIAALATRVFPTRFWAGSLAIPIACSVLVVVSPDWLVIVALVDAMILIVSAVDYGLLWRGSGGRRCVGIEVEREIPRTGSLGVAMDSILRIRNRTSMRLIGEFCDDLPEHFSAEPSSHSLDLRTGMETAAIGHLTAHRRGAFKLQWCYLRINSPLRLWQRQIRIAVRDRVNIYPDMKQLADYAMLARTNRLSLIGVRRTRRIGQDSDFERLRDYTRDDHYRHIDWRSTARRNKLTVRQFQSDQSQRLIFMLDCGRMMTNHRDGYSLLDHALNSALMMAYVALQQGDAVGMICFSDRVHAYIPPRGGASQMNRLLQAGFDQFPRMVESRYDLAFLHLSSRCKRRSLVTLMTNVIDEVNAEVVVDYLSNLGGTHLPLAVLLRDREMFDAADAPHHAASVARAATPAGEAPPRDIDTVDEFTMYRAAAAADILVWREEVLTGLRHRGVLVVDAFPDELTAPLVNQYLEVKAKHLL